jgi:sugar phosphate isomerase/epimerase
MQLAVFSNVIQGSGPAEVAAKTRAYGFDAVQFIPRGISIGFGFDRDDPESSFEVWARAYADAGVEVPAIGAYLNLLHHDPDVRRENMKKFKAFMAEMGHFGATLISTETGSLSVTSDWDPDPANFKPEALDELRGVTDEILPVAEANNVVILYEPYVVHVCYTPEMGAEFVRSYDSPHLQMLMDPTNWFGVDDLDPDTVTATLRRGFAAEHGLFRLAHAKDVAPAREPGALKPALPGPGQGVLNYPEYIKLLRAEGYDGPLVIEHLTEPEVPDAVGFVRRQLDSAAA